MVMGSPHVASAGSFDAKFRIGNSAVRINDGGFSARVRIGSGSVYHRTSRHRSAYRAASTRQGSDRGVTERNSPRSRYDTRYDHRKDRFDNRRRVVVVPVRERTVIRERPRDPDPEVIVVERPVPEPVPVEPVVLDPQGSARVVPARGRIVAPEVYELGAILPTDRPFVALNHSSYGLPVPPPGQIYARIGRSVLRIDATSRQIVAVVAN